MQKFLLEWRKKTENFSQRQMGLRGLTPVTRVVCSLKNLVQSQLCAFREVMVSEEDELLNALKESLHLDWWLWYKLQWKIQPYKYKHGLSVIGSALNRVKIRPEKLSGHNFD
ncbi:uncharacterized protein VK521_005971 [Ammospiza maritima maritima]